MFIKVGLASLILLLASRLLGLLRESAQAAAFGTSGMGDVAVMMLTLPDWLTSVLASGALAYVLLPHWAGQSAAQQAWSQRKVAHWLILGGVLVGLSLFAARVPLSQWLANGLPAQLQPMAAQGLVWSAVTLPCALLAALWVTRLQHERDFTGLYAANLVVNVSLIFALYFIAIGFLFISAVTLLGLSLCTAMGLRLLWLHWRLQRHHAPLQCNDTTSPTTLPNTSLWLWASLSAGLPLTLPFVARSFASGAGEGALATFNYAWKLVELPLVLAIQLVATLSFPAITLALQRQRGAAPRLCEDALGGVRGAFMLAWTLACACAAALQVGSPVIAVWLFGWGRMPVDSLARIAEWGAMGSFGLLPQALIAVALTVLATLGRMRFVALAYALALVILLIIGEWSGGDGLLLMVVLNAVLWAVALMVLWALVGKRSLGDQRLSLIPVCDMALPAAMLVLMSLIVRYEPRLFLMQKSFLALLIPGLIAILVIAISYFFSPDLRAALRR